MVPESVPPHPKALSPEWCCPVLPTRTELPRALEETRNPALCFSFLLIMFSSSFSTTTTHTARQRVRSPSGGGALPSRGRVCQ
jgi:hypothetical protein